MKYEEKSKEYKAKVNNGLIATLLCAIIIVGGTAWFAMARYSGKKNDAKSSPGITDSSEQFMRMTPKTESDFGQSSHSSAVSSAPKTPSSSLEGHITENSSVGTDSTVNSAEQIGKGVSSVPYSQPEKSVSSYTLPVQGDVLKKFSNTELQYSATYGDMRMHKGIDIACATGTSVSACSDGKVLAIDLNTAYGNVITISHGEHLTAKYAALGEVKVNVGDTLKTGDIIGTVATAPAECMDKPHLHFEVYKDNVAINPFTALNLE